MKRVSVGSRVSEPFAESLVFFAKQSEQSASTYIKSAIAHYARGLCSNKGEESKNCKSIAHSMQILIDNGTWQENAAANPDIFPASLPEWEAKIEKYSKKGKDADEIRAEMERQLAGFTTERDPRGEAV